MDASDLNPIPDHARIFCRDKRCLWHGGPLRVRLEMSARYGVVGAYKDRGGRNWRFYPLPFVRVSIGRELGA